jgi:hypothetical protein
LGVRQAHVVKLGLVGVYFLLMSAPGLRGDLGSVVHAHDVGERAVRTLGAAGWSSAAVKITSSLAARL